MELADVIQSLQMFQSENYVRFVAEKGENCCEKCLHYHGQIFSVSDSNRPELPIHPNCQCIYEPVSYSDIEVVKTRIQTLAGELCIYALKVTVKAASLSHDAEELIEQAQKKKEDFDFQMKVSFTIAAIQCTIFAMEKLQETRKILSDKANSLQLDITKDFYGPSIYPLSNINDLISELRKLHYLRLEENDQRLKNLPANEIEAVKRGFKLASDSQNLYHRNKGQKENKKYFHPVTGQEVVFGKDGKVVTIPENIGTKNYAPNPMTAGHVFLDMLPYWIWGNSEEDTTPLWNRIKGPDK